MPLNKIRQARIKAGLSQERVAVEVGVSQRTICNWERGSSSPALDKATLLAELLSLNVTDIPIDGRTQRSLISPTTGACCCPCNARLNKLEKRVVKLEAAARRNKAT